MLSQLLIILFIFVTFSILYKIFSKKNDYIYENEMDEEEQKYLDKSMDE